MKAIKAWRWILPALFVSCLVQADQVKIHDSFPCASGTCIRAKVECAQQPARVQLQVEGPGTAGTIALMSGGGGRHLWDDRDDTAQHVLEDLRDLGFRTVQIQWMDRWLDGAEGGREGQKALACRPAAVLEWIGSHLVEEGAPYCATGNSAGSAQVAYSLAHYGLDAILDGAVLTSGPPMSRMDLGCWSDDSRLLYTQHNQYVIDRGFGFLRRDGYCASGDRSAWRPYRKASILSGADYYFPGTRVWFLFGENDNGPAVGQGILFYRALRAAGTSVRIHQVPNGRHRIQSTRKGAQAVERALLEACQ